MSATIEVKWNGKRFPVEFQTTKELETTSVRDFKWYIQRMTGVNPSTIRLQAFGALMNNDDMPLSIYGLRSGSFVTMKVVKDNQPSNQRESTKQKTAKQPQPQEHETKHHEHKKSHNQHHKEKPASSSHTNSEEDKLVEQLQVIQNKLEGEVTPQVRKYEKDVKEFLGKSEKIEKDKKKQVYMGAYLGEQLMHVLFDLDSFTCGPDNLNARQKRKDIVRNAQELLDKVDEIKSVVKNVKVIDEKHE
ncbi:unnamed protein product [Mucor hiemalis]